MPKDLESVRIKFPPWVNRHKRITANTTVEIFLGRLIQQNQGILNTLKNIEKKLSAGKPAEKKPDENLRTIHLRSPRVIRPGYNPPPEGEKPPKPTAKPIRREKGFKKDGTS